MRPVTANIKCSGRTDHCWQFKSVRIIQVSTQEKHPKKQKNLAQSAQILSCAKCNRHNLTARITVSCSKCTILLSLSVHINIHTLKTSALCSSFFFWVNLICSLAEIGSKGLALCKAPSTSTFKGGSSVVLVRKKTFSPRRQQNRGQFFFSGAAVSRRMCPACSSSCWGLRNLQMTSSPTSATSFLFLKFTC